MLPITETVRTATIALWSGSQVTPEPAGTTPGAPAPGAVQNRYHRLSETSWTSLLLALTSWHFGRSASALVPVAPPRTPDRAPRSAACATSAERPLQEDPLQRRFSVWPSRLIRTRPTHPRIGPADPGDHGTARPDGTARPSRRRSPLALALTVCLGAGMLTAVAAAPAQAAVSDGLVLEYRLD